MGKGFGKVAAPQFGKAPQLGKAVVQGAKVRTPAATAKSSRAKLAQELMGTTK